MSSVTGITEFIEHEVRKAIDKAILERDKWWIEKLGNCRYGFELANDDDHDCECDLIDLIVEMKKGK